MAEGGGLDCGLGELQAANTPIASQVYIIISFHMCVREQKYVNV